MSALTDRIFVAGHNGMVGSAIVRHLSELGYKNIITRSRSKLDLTRQSEVEDFFHSEEFNQVYLAAAKVGGILANNTYPAEFIYENLLIESNIIHTAHKFGVQKLLFLGSSCIYPKNAEQPMKEESLLTGKLEPTNEPYAIAKIAGIKLCESYNRQYGRDYRSVMPTNLYGPGDNYHPEDSHVIPALIRRFHEAKSSGASAVTIWGTGKPYREFLYVDDMARACAYVMHLSFDDYASCTEAMLGHINIGYGEEISISDLAVEIAKVVGFNGQINFDSSKPDGSPRKLMNSNRIRSLGWNPVVSLEKGLQLSYKDFLSSRRA